VSATEEPVDWTRVTARLLLSRVPEDQRREIRAWLDQYRLDVRATALREAADAIGAFADAAEQDAIACDGQAYGRSNRTVAAYRETEELVRRLANNPKEQS
jgi:hypothetical protein